MKVADMSISGGPELHWHKYEQIIAILVADGREEANTTKHHIRSFSDFIN